ncbi:MAG: dual specificity protein phosphatase [Propionicimonas sp.]|uniref:dual specificity protein phosphatase family protein n=1 Tax=Propionicimonas sp. TaxID=1955623 RepID=UPI003D127942
MSTPRTEPAPGSSASPTVFALANANFVTDRLAVGGDLSPRFALARQQLDELVTAGITHIVDLREEWSDETLVENWAPQVRYLQHRVADAGQQIDGPWFADLVAWVDAALADPAAKVLVHCHMGVNRAPSAMLAILLAQGTGLRPALDAIRASRPVAVIDYASSALGWYLESTDADARTRRNARRTLARWRRANQLDVGKVIRSIRDTEHPPNRWLVHLGPDDPHALAGVLDEAGDVAVGLSMHTCPEQLSQLDEVVFLTDDGLVGRALVVGPMQPAEPHALLLPVVVTNLFDPVPLNLPPAVEEWLADGTNPRLLEPTEYGRLTVRAAPEPADDAEPHGGHEEQDEEGTDEAAEA